MKRASGNSRVRVGAWATVSVLCSTIPIAPSLSDGAEREQVEEQASAGLLGLVGKAALEPRRRLVEPLAVDKAVHAAKPPGLKAAPPKARAAAP